MKTNKIIKRLSLALVGFAALATTSCKDEPDAYKIADGKPTVMFIRPVSAASRDSIITSASMQTTVCIVGENLRSVTGLLFNDQAAVLNTSYMTDNTLIVTIPNEIPGSVTDKISGHKQQGYRNLRLPCGYSCTRGGFDDERMGRGR